MGAPLELAVAILIPLGTSFLIGSVVQPGEWYKTLNKPSWTPPGWAFPVIWTFLYVSMGVASWLVWKKGGFEGQSVALGLYSVQLLLNFLWTPIFFGMHLVFPALVEIVAMWFAILATIVAFAGVNKVAAGLLVPYLCWVSVATSLNLYIHRHNKAPGGKTRVD